MINKEDIITFYKTLRRYKDHDKTLELCVNHYFPKVSRKMTVKEFDIKVKDIIRHHLNNVNKLGE